MTARSVSDGYVFGNQFLNGGVEIDTLQADWTPQALRMSREEVERDIRLLTKEGATYAGADVYLYVAQKIWWAYLFGLLFSLPGVESSFRQVTDGSLKIGIVFLDIASSEFEPEGEAGRKSASGPASP